MHGGGALCTPGRPLRDRRRWTALKVGLVNGGFVGRVSPYMAGLYERYRAAQFPSFPLPGQCFPCLSHKSQFKVQYRITLLHPHLRRNSPILPLRSPWPCRQHQTPCSIGGQDMGLPVMFPAYRVWLMGYQDVTGWILQQITSCTPRNDPGVLLKPRLEPCRYACNRALAPASIESLYVIT